MKVITCNLDRRIWRDLLKISGMISLMHAATSDKWSRNLERGDIPARLCNMRKKSPYLRTSSSLNMAVRRGLTRFARPAGSLFAVLSVCPTGCAATRPIPGPRPTGPAQALFKIAPGNFVSNPVRASHPRQAVQHAKKKPVLAYELFLKYGGEAGIRTPDTLPYTHFPGVLLQPLGHLTILLFLCYRNGR